MHLFTNLHTNPESWLSTNDPRVLVSPCLAVQDTAARRADAAPPGAGDAGLHADAVRHVLQHLDLPRGRRGLRTRLLHCVSSAERLTGWTRPDPTRPGLA